MVEEEPPVLAMQSADNKVVSMICTASNANDKVPVNRRKKVGGMWDINNEVQQPLAFQAYNRYMNAVDRFAQCPMKVFAIVESHLFLPY